MQTLDAYCEGNRGDHVLGGSEPAIYIVAPSSREAIAACVTEPRQLVPTMQR